MFKLYEIPKEIERVLDLYMDDDGNISEEGASLMDALDINMETKVLNTAKKIKSLLLEAEAVKSACDNLSKRKKSLENKAEALKKYIGYYAPNLEFSDAEIEVKWRKSYALPKEYDKDIVPDMFKTIVQDVKIDGIALKKAIQKGEFLGFALIENNNIQIK